MIGRFDPRAATAMERHPRRTLARHDAVSRVRARATIRHRAGTPARCGRSWPMRRKPGFRGSSPRKWTGVSGRVLGPLSAAAATAVFASGTGAFRPQRSGIAEPGQVNSPGQLPAKRPSATPLSIPQRRTCRYMGSPRIRHRRIASRSGLTQALVTHGSGPSIRRTIAIEARFADHERAQRLYGSAAELAAASPILATSFVCGAPASGHVSSSAPLRRCAAPA